MKVELALGDGVAEAEEVKEVVQGEDLGALKMEWLWEGQKMILELRGTQKQEKDLGQVLALGLALRGQ